MSIIELNVLLQKANQLSLRICFECVTADLNMRKMKMSLLVARVKLQVPI
ncbi:hypothetical protein NP493_1165g01058 [Ridgeia piscesae]|uniref:Uncharacterized protein n=1 Tax=Ridgeia piscesae TaxID=27915 RepID=A0AAD9KFY6_RIDPI|nr:hypothetical protein NP493_1165g01058 [Ridgeia piscesae]